MTPAPELLPWHGGIFAELNAQAAHKRLPHACLLQGQQGIGKELLARYFAQSLLCRAPLDGRPCQTCQGCVQVLAGSHPDLRILQPEESRDIKIEQVRDVVGFMSKTARQGSWKIVIIVPADAMNSNAANALLKSLEEPPSGTLLLLVTHQAGLLPATIISRCRMLNLPVPEIELARHWLEEKNTAGPINTLLKLAGGAPLRALALSDDDNQHERSKLTEAIQGLMEGHMNTVEAAAQCRDFSILDVIDNMIYCANDILRFNQSQGRMELKDGQLRAIAMLVQTGSAARGLHRLYNLLLEARKGIIRKTNPNTQLLLESLFFGWSKLNLEH